MLPMPSLLPVHPRLQVLTLLLRIENEFSIDRSTSKQNWRVLHPCPAVDWRDRVETFTLYTHYGLSTERSDHRCILGSLVPASPNFTAQRRSDPPCSSANTRHCPRRKRAALFRSSPF